MYCASSFEKKKINILGSIEEFQTEEAHEEYFRAQRALEGIKQEVGGTHHYWLKAKNQWQCSSCNFRITLKSGSTMKGSKVNFQMWYKQWHLCHSVKRQFQQGNCSAN